LIEHWARYIFFTLSNKQGLTQWEFCFESALCFLVQLFLHFQHVYFAASVW
jgi:hypothetical protein